MSWVWDCKASVSRTALPWRHDHSDEASLSCGDLREDGVRCRQSWGQGIADEVGDPVVEWLDDNTDVQFFLPISAAIFRHRCMVCQERFHMTRIVPRLPFGYPTDPVTGQPDKRVSLLERLKHGGIGSPLKLRSDPAATPPGRTAVLPPRETVLRATNTSKQQRHEASNQTQLTPRNDGSLTRESISNRSRSPAPRASTSASGDGSQAGADPIRGVLDGLMKMYAPNPNIFERALGGTVLREHPVSVPVPITRPMPRLPMAATDAEFKRSARTFYENSVTYHATTRQSKQDIQRHGFRLARKTRGATEVVSPPIRQALPSII